MSMPPYLQHFKKANLANAARAEGSQRDSSVVTAFFLGETAADRPPGLNNDECGLNGNCCAKQ